ncbi:twin-arginine translocation signal domain-containing protein [Natrinema pallidum]|uniref:Calcium-binding outer membrane-like protein n=2 Tax=Natrinema pallidum TaxID=69527 RepID=L9YM69_9EURY|nr:twin-arginine translocation signal domain-containing protein [Natrinema pallidum]ELY74572.1 calcium-binding outer membrane-like protein [Natrinema pallidum DSM 3751]
MTDETDSGLFDDSRRSFMKKSALTAGAVALGTAGAGTAAAQDGGSVVVFGDDYEPGVDLTVVSALNDGTKDELFSEAGLEDEFDTPDDWDVYIINYDVGGSAPSLGFLMSEDVDLSAGDSETMGADGQFRDSELSLVEATPGETGGGGDGGGGGDSETESDEPMGDGGNESGGGN